MIWRDSADAQAGLIGFDDAASTSLTLKNEVGDLRLLAGGYEHIRIKGGATTLVGIGTASPSYTLHVVGTGSFTGDVSLGNLTSSGAITALTNFNSTTGNDLRLNAGSVNRDVLLQVNGVTLMTVQGSTGSVGIGTASPRQRLDLGAGQLVLNDGYGIGWGTHTTNIGGSSASGVIVFYTNSAEAMRIDSSQNVGIGTASPTQKLHVAGNILSTGQIISSHATGGIGYTTGAGGTATQSPSKTATVTLNKVCGKITMHSAALAGNTRVSFQFNNTAIAATDVVVVNRDTGGSDGAYAVHAENIAAGSCRITLANLTSGSLSDAVVLHFAVIKAVQA